METIITELTEDQKSKLYPYAIQGCEIGLKATTEEINVDKVYELVNKHLELILGDQYKKVIPRDRVLVYDSPWEAIKNHNKEGVTVSSAFYGNQDIIWLQYYNYWRCETELGGHEQTKETLGKIRYLMELTKYVGWFWVGIAEQRIILTKLPIFSNTKMLQVTFGDFTGDIPYIHNEEGPAVKWADGSALYAYDGQTIGTHLNTEYNWLVTTPANELDLKKILAIDNVDMRAIGLTRLPAIKLSEQMTTIHEKTFPIGGHYKLKEIEIGGETERYLEMRCPSGKDVRVERVPPTIKTVDQALWWRPGFDDLAASDTPYVEPAAQS